ncbi:MAG: hypothetical protein SX243_12990 [Acidobacteriota bacterium]|nr:hypothetical protein [Acidobacteriota bacterium]
MPEHSRYQALDAVKIEHTIARLSERIENRFPGSGLFRLSTKVLAISREAQAQAEWIARPILSLRIAITVLILIILAGIAGTLGSLRITLDEVHFLDFIQALEAGINDVVLIGLGIFFLISLERRLKRHRALGAIHELRALAHIIDMHQLTKDPTRIAWNPQPDDESTEGKLTPFELSRYLDYCSEMLSLLGKISVLYVQRFDDAVALAAVNEVEQLTTGLSRKIWQKLMMIPSIGTSLGESPSDTEAKLKMTDSDEK